MGLVKFKESVTRPNQPGNIVRHRIKDLLFRDGYSGWMRIEVGGELLGYERDLPRRFLGGLPNELIAADCQEIMMRDVGCGVTCVKHYEDRLVLRLSPEEYAQLRECTDATKAGPVMGNVAVLARR